MITVPRLVLAVLTCVILALLPARGALVGPVYPPPLGVTFSQSGSQGDTEIGRASGKTWYISNVPLANSTTVYWGADNNGVALSMYQQPFQSYEYCSYKPELSNLSGGIVVWTGASYIPHGTWVATKFTLTVRDGSSNPVPLSDAAGLGLSGYLGGVVKVISGLSFSANLKFEASYASNNTGWTPALDLFDAAGATWGTSGATYSRFQAGFYYRETMAVLPSSLTFTGQVYSAIAPQTLTVTNTGSGTLNYKVASDSFWLSADTPTGTLAAGAGTTVVVRAATRGLAPRTYTGRLTVSDADGINAPQVVSVSLALSAVTPPSKVLAWGLNGNGQTSVPAGLTNAVAVVGGSYHSLALRANGTLTTWGSNNYGESSIPGGLPSVTAVAAGYCDSLVLFANGALYAWGYNGYGAISGQPSGLNDVVAVAAGDYHLLALRANGTVTAWGWNDYGQTTVTPGLTNAVAVSGGVYHSLALRADGTVTAWGANSDGQLNVPADLTNAVAVAAGKFHSLALKANGTVAAWGGVSYGATSVPPGLTNVVAISAGYQSSQALRADGTVVDWGYNDYGQGNVPPGLTNAVAVTSGSFHSLALVPANTLVVSSPYGSPSPARGTNWVIRDTPQICSVDSLVSAGTTQYICTGWIGIGSVSASGTVNSTSFVISNNSSIAWLWQTNYWLEVQTHGNGSVNAGSGWRAAGSNVLLTATNPYGYMLANWSGDTNGCTIAGTQQITAPMIGARRIDAWFIPVAIIGTQPPSLAFTGQVFSTIAPQTFAITNTGAEVLNYTITSDSFWLAADFPSGTLVPGAGTTVVVRVATRGLAPRTYAGRLILTGAATLNSPFVQPVTLTVQPPPPPTATWAWGNNQYGQTNVPAGLTSAVAVAGGEWHSLARCADGSVIAWGDNAYGQTTVPTGLTNAAYLAAGWSHSLAVRAAGSVSAWGNNSSGQCTPPAGLTNAAAVSGGFQHSLAACTDGTVAAWGWNAFGQTNVPAGLTNAVAVSGGFLHSLALRGNGTVAAWGDNSVGQTNVPADLTNAVAVAAGMFHSLALKANGTVVAWGDNSAGQTNVPPGLNNVLCVAAGDDHCLALRADGSVVAWGDNSAGQTNLPAGLSGAIAIAGGGHHSLALVPVTSLTVSSPYGSPSPARGTNWVIRNTPQVCTVDASVTVGGTQYVCTGWTGTGSVPTSGNTNSVTFTITNDSSIAWQWAVDPPAISIPTPALTFSGMVYRAIAPQSLVFTNTGGSTLNCTIASDAFWLSADSPGGALAPGAGTTIVVRVGTRGLAPRTYTGHLTIADPLALNSPQIVTVTLLLNTVSLPTMALSWGGNGYGQASVPVGMTNVTGVAAGYYLSLFLRADGTVNACGYNGYGQTSVPGWLTDATAVSAGFFHSLALRTNGTVAAWGCNSSGENNVPAGLDRVVSVAGGGIGGLALRAEGTVVAWGNNSYGTTNVPPGLSNVVAATEGGYHALALRADGSVVGWGSDSYGQRTVSADLTNAVAVAAGGYHSLVLRADGTVVVWGQNSYGQLNVPAGLSNVVAIAAGWQHSLALRVDGSVVAWGDNSAGQCNVPAGLVNAVAVAGGGDHTLALVPASALTVASPHGSPSPARGTNWVIRNTPQVCTVDASVTVGGTQYVCTGWTGTGNVPARVNTNSVSFTITNGSSIAWLWSTNYAINASANAYGMIAPNGQIWVPQGNDQTFVIAADPLHGTIQNVVVDGSSVGVVSGYTFPNVTGSHSIQAQFVLAYPGSNGCEFGAIDFAETSKLLLRFVATNGWRYTLQQTPTLVPTAWSNVPSCPDITGTGLMVLTNRMGDSRQLFFRLQASPSE